MFDVVFLWLVTKYAAARSCGLGKDFAGKELSNTEKNLSTSEVITRGESRAIVGFEPSNAGNSNVLVTQRVFFLFGTKRALPDWQAAKSLRSILRSSADKVSYP